MHNELYGAIDSKQKDPVQNFDCIARNRKGEKGNGVRKGKK